jgi:hypothetical protein
MGAYLLGSSTRFQILASNFAQGILNYFQITSITFILSLSLKYLHWEPCTYNYFFSMSFHLKIGESIHAHIFWYRDWNDFFQVWQY